jgi:hypothetical protein
VKAIVPLYTVSVLFLTGCTETEKFDVENNTTESDTNEGNQTDSENDTDTDEAAPNYECGNEGFYTSSPSDNGRYVSQIH